MDCFCLRKKNVYDFSSPYTMASSGTYRTSVMEDTSPSKNGHVQLIEKSNENHHDSIISDDNHVTEDKAPLEVKNATNDLHNDIEKDNDSHKDDDDKDKDLSDVNRNHESQPTPDIVIEEVTEVNQVNMTFDEEQGQDRTSKVSISSENDLEANELEERHSLPEETKDIQDDRSDRSDDLSDVVQGHSESRTITDDHDRSSTDKDHFSYEEEQNLRNSSYSEDPSEDRKQEVSENDRKSDHTPSYDVTAAAGDVPKDVVHMY